LKIGNLKIENLQATYIVLTLNWQNEFSLWSPAEQCQSIREVRFGKFEEGETLFVNSEFIFVLRSELGAFLEKFAEIWIDKESFYASRIQSE